MAINKWAEAEFEEIVTVTVILPLLALGIISHIDSVVSTDTNDIWLTRTLVLNRMAIGDDLPLPAKESAILLNSKLFQLSLVLEQLFAVYFDNTNLKVQLQDMKQAMPMDEALNSNLCALVAGNLRGYTDLKKLDAIKAKAASVC